MAIKIKQEHSEKDVFISLDESSGDGIDLDFCDEDGAHIFTFGRITNEGELHLFEAPSDERSQLYTRGIKFEDCYVKVKKC